MKDIMRLKEVGKAFHIAHGLRWVFRKVSFSVKQDEILAIVGPSGSGKTTLIKVMANLENPTEGKIEIRPSFSLSLVSLVSHDYGLVPWLTVKENLELVLERFSYSKPFIEEKIKQYLDLIGLEGYEEAYPSELSRGMRQKVMLARALIVEPSLLLMDEPFSDLDPLSARALRDELLKLWEDPEFPVESIVFATHNIEEAVYLADRIIVLGKDAKLGATTVKKVINVKLPRPRNEKGKAFQRLVDEVYGELMRVV